jgi:hypothetical protein
MSAVKTYMQTGNRSFQEISTPSAPSAGYANMWAADMGGFGLPQWASAGGLAIPMAPGLFGKRFCTYSYRGVGTGASAFDVIGCSIFTHGTVDAAYLAAATPSSRLNMNPYTYMYTNTDGVSAGFSVVSSARNTLMAYRSALSGAAGGFLSWVRFSIDGLGGTEPSRDGVSVGFTQSTTLQPGGNNNLLVVGNDAEDAQLSFMHNDDTGASTKVGLGVAPSYLNGKLVDLAILCERAGNAHFRLHILDTNEVYTATASSNLPVDNAPMYMRICATRHRGSGSVLVSVLQGGHLEL